MRVFLKKKGIELSWRTYLITALSYMALGLFSSLIVGLIIQTAGEQIPAHLFIGGFLADMGSLAMSLLGPAIGVAVAYALKAPPLVMFSAVASGAAGEELGGPAGAFIAVLISVECGKLISKETRFDILLTPFVTIATGFVLASTVGPAIGNGLEAFGSVINWATEQEPLTMSILVSALMGLALTFPISSAAIAIMLGLDGLAAGAATVGCCAQMVGFAVSSFRENRWGGLVSLGIGTSMLQVPNMVRNPWIVVPPTLAGMMLAPIAVIFFNMESNAEGAGMGTSGFVGQIMTFSTMGFTMQVFILILVFHIVLPGVLTYVIDRGLRKSGRIKDGDMTIDQG
ncbi:PTS sugar transporter subunit IIC [Salicibibacter cibi]|uniref:PTS sugar transporter subunit IIC n=1 Tax=Salicibibacter cibi TaxID=2743001 RepID=A0A7T6ZDC9_9BACI|nr:PTS sugar transporter subunit IIC [Salicibibacter cibi]QQK81190.1 PTS sugar transporter subunit IIC [Salicibibacter cibi]